MRPLRPPHESLAAMRAVVAKQVAQATALAQREGLHGPSIARGVTAFG